MCDGFVSYTTDDADGGGDDAGGLLMRAMPRRIVVAFTMTRALTMTRAFTMTIYDDNDELCACVVPMRR